MLKDRQLTTTRKMSAQERDVRVGRMNHDDRAIRVMMALRRDERLVAEARDYAKHTRGHRHSTSSPTVRMAAVAPPSAFNARRIMAMIASTFFLGMLLGVLL